MIRKPRCVDPDLTRACDDRTSTGSPAASRRDRPALVIEMAIVAIAVLATHWPALSARAISFDDDQYLVTNRMVKNPSWSHARRFLTEVLEPSTVGGYYQPLTMISLMIDSALGGGVENLRPYHRTSLALHLCNSLLVVVLLFALFRVPAAAVLAGLFFGVHPLTVETIPWVGERKTLLATMFALLGLILHVSHARRGGRSRYAAGLVMYVLALLSKPTSTPLPVMMLLMDVWPLGRFGRRAILEKFPFFVIGVLSAIVTYVSQARTSGVILPTQHGPLRIPISICHNMVFYLQKMLWPANLSSHYPIPRQFSLADPAQLAYVLLAILLLALLVLSLRWTRAFFIGWLIFIVGLLPTMQIVGFTTVIASDKYAYLPAIGLLMALCWSLAGLWRRMQQLSRPRLARAGICVVACALACAEALVSRRYLEVWRDTETLFRHMLALAPTSPTLYTNLGNHLMKQNRLDEALALHQKAVLFGPGLWLGQHDYGNALYNVGRVDEAIERYRMALDIHPDFALGHTNLGIALLSKGRTAEALPHLQAAVEIEPKLAIAHYNLATVLAELGDPADAITSLQKAVDLNPDHADAHNNLAVLLARSGRTDEAIAHFREAVRLAEDPSEAHFNLARALENAGRASEAMVHYRETLRLHPDDQEARRALEALATAHGSATSAPARGPPEGER